MSDLRKAAEMALNAMLDIPMAERPKAQVKAIQALRQALAQPGQEPFGYFCYDLEWDGWVETEPDNGKPLYTAPPSIEDAVLAEREACARLIEDWDSDMMDPRDGADAIRARGEK